MRRTFLLTLLGALAAAACGDSGSVTGPESPDPQFHVVDEGLPADNPDGNYSQYFVDLQLFGDLWVKVAQEWDQNETSTRCTDGAGNHAVNDDPAFEEVKESLTRAEGSGYFSLRTPAGWRTGLLWVKRACWFDEWNDAGGFPESTWIAGRALVGWRLTSFHAKLVSNGFPAEGHRDAGSLDAAELFLGDIDGVSVVGELHHEDGTSLVE